MLGMPDKVTALAAIDAAELTNRAAFDEFAEGSRLRGYMLRRILVQGATVHEMSSALRQLRAHRKASKAWLERRLMYDMPAFKVTLRHDHSDIDYESHCAACKAESGLNREG